MLIRGEEIFFIDYEKDNSKSLLYAPLRSYLSLIDNATKEKLEKDIDSDIVDQVIGFLKNREYIDIYKIHHIVTNSRPQLSIPITDNCNLRCRYCYFRAGEKRKDSMSYEMIDGILISYFKEIDKFEYKDDDKSLIITIAGGGEPTVEFEKFKYTINKAKEIAESKNLKCNFSMPTNGYYDDDVRKFIVDNFSHISLSMDGPEHIQNLHRQRIDGKGSFDKVYETARYFYNNELPFAFRATVSNYSINYLEDIIDFFAIEFPNITIAFESLNLMGRAEDDEEICPPNAELFATRIVDAYKYAENKNIQLKTAGAGKFDRLRTVFCGAVGVPHWTITTDGRVASCTRDNLPEIFTFGNFDQNISEIVIDQNKIAKLRKLNCFDYKECQDCFCKYNCAGDCPDLRVSNMHDCTSNKSVGKYILNKKIEHV